MFVDDLQTSRKIAVSILLAVVQLIVIITFGGGWTSFKYANTVRAYLPYSTLVPYPGGSAWWCELTAIVMYLSLILSILYVAWTVAQVSIPDRIPFETNLKFLVFIDALVSGILTLLLIFAFSFFAGGFSGTYQNPIFNKWSLGYCFWLCVVASIGSLSALLISGISWFRN